MRRKFCVVSSIIGILTCSSFCDAQEGLVNVRGLVKTSEIIVTGLSSPDKISGSASTSFTIQIDRVIKGNVTAGEVLSITDDSPKPDCDLRALQNPAYALWFLNSLPGGRYKLVPSLRTQRCDRALGPFEITPGPLPNEWSYDEGTQIEDKLAFELAASFAAHKGDGPWEFIRNPFLLTGASSSALHDIYTKFNDSSLSHIHLEGVLGLARMGDPSTLFFVQNNLTRLSNTELRSTGIANGHEIPIRYGKSGAERRTYAHLLEDAIRGISDPINPTVLALGDLLNSSSLSIRRAAAQALQNIHTPLAVQELAPLLQDADRDLRTYAIGGIACYANGCPPINSNGNYVGPDLMQPSPYKNHETLMHFAMGTQAISLKEDYYLEYWRKWWAENAASVVTAAQR